MLSGTHGQNRERPAEATIRQSALPDLDYRIGPEDVLSISVWRNQDLTMDVPVRPDGMISFPLIDDIKAQGLTTLELRDLITEKLKEYVTVLDVTVIVSQINSYKAFILGEVRTPGVYEIRSNTTILQLIAMAGGLSEFASPNKLIVLRMDEEKQERKIKVKLKDAMDGSDMTQNLLLQPMDTVIVN
jgi:polysaccharide export outer membrane protein